ncbi:hypothetical protein [Methylorubrum sp. SB2]|uniref:hypothetical protein n=1 Tax=Methylorubrum subtropicum TaxID=3138812 RepID=UPI00313DB6D4
MSATQLQTNDEADVQFYEIDIPVRGCQFNLKLFKNVYRELQKISRKEADRIVDAFIQPPDKTLEQFEADKRHVKDRAFRLTVSVVGVDGQTSYGDTEKIFDLDTLPKPIDTIFITNENAFKPYASGQSPSNYFRLWVHFSKPPLIDGASLLSEPTPNASKTYIRADDITYFRAVQTIINKGLMKNRQWYYLIHGRAVYDVGFWLFALPYALYLITSKLDTYVPADGPYSSYRVAGFIYGIGIILVSYRVLMGYFKWAFPVNILEENNDQSLTHRIIFGGIILGVLGNALSSLLGF